MIGPAAVAWILLAAATPPNPLTLPAAIAAASENFPAVGAASGEAAAAHDTVRELEAARLPSVTLGATATRYSDPMLATPIHGFDLRNPPAFSETITQSALSATYSLYDAGARESRIAEASHAAASADAATDGARIGAAARAASAYASALGRAAIVEANDARILALESERKRVLEFESAGRAAHVDVLRVDAALAAAVAERGDAAASLDAAERTLARITGLPLETTRAANLAPLDEAALPLPDRSALEQEAGDAPPVRQARSRAAAQEAAIGFARSGRRPQVAASAQELFFGTATSLLAEEWNVGLQLRFNVFDGGATTARIARATDAARAAREQADAVAVESRIAIDRAYADLQQSRDAAAGLSAAIAKFDEVARVEKLRLENGAGTQSDYLRALADLLGARANLAAARYRAVAARVELARVTGQLTPSWIEATFGARP